MNEAITRDLLSALEAAHRIIEHALNLMTPEQKSAWAEKNDAAGLVEAGTTRYHERRKVINAAKAALADASAPGVEDRKS